LRSGCNYFPDAVFIRRIYGPADCDDRPWHNDLFADILHTHIYLGGITVRVYLSHPFGGKNENRIKAAWLAKWYREQWEQEGRSDWELVNPLDELRELDGKISEPEILQKAVDLMFSCDMVIFAPGWVHSHGCLYEHDAALQGKMIIFHIPTEFYKGAAA
jgi:hypothetical protein